MTAPKKYWKGKKDKKPPKRKRVPPTNALVYRAYTDGSALGNPGPGGYGAIIRQGTEVHTISKGYYLTTNNRMELLAVIAVLEEFGPNKQFEIYSDSSYVIQGCSSWVYAWERNGWVTLGGQPVKNADLWARVRALMRENKVHFIKVKGHSGIPDNEFADELAVTAAMHPSEKDSWYEKNG